MQKYLKMLEDQVQWIAIGIGGLFFVWMLWSYVLQTPVSVMVAGKPVAPGEVDQLIAEGPLVRVEAAIKSDVAVPQMPVVPFRKNVIDELAGRTYHVPMIAGLNVPHHVDLGLIGPTKGSENGSNNPNLAQNLMQQVPLTPIAVFTDSAQGRSTVNKSAMAQPNLGGIPNANPQITPADIDWVSLSFKVDPKEIAANYVAAGVPAYLNSQCLFLQVELLREELIDPDTDRWSASVTIKPLANVVLLPYPGDRAPLASAAQYDQWAEKNQADIIAPAFYVVTKGDQWYEPGKSNPNVVAAPKIEPVPLPDVPKPTPPRPTPPKPPRPTPKTPKYPPSERAVPDPDRPTQLAQAIPPMFEMPPGSGTPSNPAFGQPAGAAVAGAAQVPAGKFDPGTTTGYFEIRAHDDTVQAGHTYRYKLRYRLRNPAFNMPRAAIPAVAAQFGVASLGSAPTRSIKIVDRVNFWVKRGVVGNKVTFEVYKWENGQQHAKAFDVGVGDMVGSTDKDVDYRTGWTVVDFRNHPTDQADKEVLLMDQQGHTLRRSFSSDQANFKKLMNDLKNEVDRANTGAAAATGS